MKEPGLLAIIGGGPAGYTAALYAARADVIPHVFLGPQPGGQLMLTTEVENYPGYPDGVMGPQMMEDFKRQAERFGAIMRHETIVKVDFGESPFTLYTDTGKAEKYHAVIIATGASARWLGLPEEERLRGRGVSSCATCDGFFFKGKVVGVVGGGDTACEEALYLSKLCKKVFMFLRRDVFRASAIMQKRVKEKPNIEIIYNVVVNSIYGEEQVEGVQLKSTVDGSLQDIKLDGLFVAIGHKPNSEIFKEWLEMDEEGYIIVKPWSTHTNIEGVFACGDVIDRRYRQAVTAAGTGCMAALDARDYLSEKGLI